MTCGMLLVPQILHATKQLLYLMTFVRTVASESPLTYLSIAKLNFPIPTLTQKHSGLMFFFLCCVIDIYTIALQLLHLKCYLTGQLHTNCGSDDLCIAIFKPIRKQVNS